MDLYYKTRDKLPTTPPPPTKVIRVTMGDMKMLVALIQVSITSLIINLYKKEFSSHIPQQHTT